VRWRLFAAGGLVYVAALAATLPATLADAALQSASAGRLRLAAAQGTLWSGGGQLEVRSADGRGGLARSLTWRIQPAALLRAQLAYEVRFDQGRRSFPLIVSWPGIKVENADISLPAAALSVGVPKLAPLDLTGEVQIRVETLAIEHGVTRGSATLQWRAAGSTFSPVSPLGDYELRVDAAGDAVRATLRTLQGPLQLDGEGAWTNGRAPVFVATARVAKEFEQVLAPFLHLIAVERGDGTFELRLN
jgi:general secretion pathway protein N